MNIASPQLKSLHASTVGVLPFSPFVFSLTLVLPAPGDLLHQGRPAKKSCMLSDN